MNKKIIIVTGYLAAGKTTFALKLSKELGVPCFSKDLLKLALSRSILVNNREESKQLSAATFDAIAFITEKFMETGNPLIIEANFVMTENHNKLKEGDALKALAETYGYQVLTYLFLGDLHVLCDRFNEREKTPERAEVHRMGDMPFTYDAFEKVISPLGDFNIGGEIVKINATDFNAVDFGKHLETAHSFINTIFTSI
jgi:predicted kinase